MSEVRARWAKLPPAERDRRMTQSAADRARYHQDAGAAPTPTARMPEQERRRRPGQSDAARAQTTRWAGLPEEERRRRQAQSDAARAAARRAAAPPASDLVVELEDDGTLQAMGHTIEHGGYDFMSKDDW
jgi:hypothetical protein